MSETSSDGAGLLLSYRGLEGERRCRQRAASRYAVHWRFGIVRDPYSVLFQVAEGFTAGFDADREHVPVRVQNTALPEFQAGIVQGLVEMAYSVDSSTCSWEFFDDGDTLITVRIR